MSLSFFVTLSIAIVAVPFASIWLIAVGIAGRRDATRPCCGKCGADIGFDQFEADQPCANCTARVSEHAPSAARRRPWFSVLIGGIALMVLSVLLAVTGITIRSFTTRLGGSPANLTNTALTTAGLAAQYSAGDPVREIRTRIDDGRMTVAELKSALLAGLGPDDAPAPQQTSQALALAAIVFERGAGESNFASRVVDGCFAAPALWPQILATNHPVLQLDPTVAPQPDHALTYVALARSLSVDGQVRNIADAQWSTPLHAAVLPLALKPFEPGTHRVLLEVELRLYPRFDASRIRGPDFAPLAESDWPMPLATKTVTLACDFEAPAR